MQTLRNKALLAGAIFCAATNFAIAEVKAPSSAQVKIGAHHLAPGASTIAGEDVNKNGVRDDVEEFLIANAKSSSVRKAYQELAKQLQRILVEVPSGLTTATTLSKDIETAMLGLGRETAFFTQAPIKISKLERIVFNTSERKNAYETFTAAFYNGQ
jgi:hypothetical protein